MRPEIDIGTSFHFYYGNSEEGAVSLTKNPKLQTFHISCIDTYEMKQN
jgi:hypothetical protein